MSGYENTQKKALSGGSGLPPVNGELPEDLTDGSTPHWAARVEQASGNGHMAMMMTRLKEATGVIDQKLLLPLIVFSCHGMSTRMN